LRKKAFSEKSNPVNIRESEKDFDDQFKMHENHQKGEKKTDLTQNTNFLLN
jgi:hypothetical protein